MTHTLKPIDDQELAKLHAKFVVPIAVDLMLRDEEPLDDVAEYTMHDIIGALQPDTALLCIALCCQHIAVRVDHLMIGKALRAEADMIINEYGPLWLAHASGNAEDVEDSYVRDLLEQIPEDLESIGELLQCTCAELDENYPIPAILCDILETQARMHKEYAEYELNGIGMTAQEPGEDRVRERHVAPDGANDNVVLFPGNR